jgi:translation initiation factor IF-3
LTITGVACIDAPLHYFLSQNNLRPNYQGNQAKDTRTRINAAIKAPELRIITDTGENLGILSLADAIKAAEERKLDLIEISPKATPPIAKIMDYGKYRYETGRKAREVKAKSHITETKSVQVKIGTGDHDQQLKAKKTAEWLAEGHRVKVDLFLWGRYKYMEEGFLKERLDRFLKIIPVEYKIADPMKKSPKGWTTTLERVAAAKAQKPKILSSEKVATVKKTESNEQKNKKKSLDDLLESGLI